MWNEVLLRVVEWGGGEERENTQMSINRTVAKDSEPMWEDRAAALTWGPGLCAVVVSGKSRI